MFVCLSVCVQKAGLAVEKQGEFLMASSLVRTRLGGEANPAEIYENKNADFFFFFYFFAGYK